ncbi:hypothetical protein [Fictibacillus sp. JL2B1089]|uniref:hypothetical protein n=1 Tax=Fictibacillus sp. JL2B1089 TaxID=3399565 RepID=UPI003A85216D
MQKAKCIDDGGALNLAIGDEYFVTPSDDGYYLYCYRFPNSKNAYFGVYPSRLFKLSEAAPVIEKGKWYTGELVYSQNYKLEYKRYFLRLNQKTHVYFYEGIDKSGFQGCFPLEWFKDIREAAESDMTGQEMQEIVHELKENEPIQEIIVQEPDHFEQMSLF